MNPSMKTPTKTRATLIIFSKEPVPGRVKTRLVPHLSPAASARLHDAFVRDAVSRLTRTSAYEVVLAYAPDSGKSYFEEFGLPLFSQGPGGLGERMERCLARTNREPGDRAVLIGTDIPSLTPDDMAAAFSALERIDAVFGPSTDGGFFLVGFRGPVPAGLFDGVAWSVPDTLEQTEKRVRQLMLRSKRIASRLDVDTIDDLRRLRASDCGPATRAVLQELDEGLEG